MSENKNPNANGEATPNGAAGAPGAADAVNPLQEQADKFKNDYLYLRAEFENYKKHAIKERSELVKYGAEKLAKDLLGVLDNFERALSAPVTAENFGAFKTGVDMTAQELRNLLQKHGITEVKSEGAFDPSYHEALSSEVNDSIPAGHISKVFQKAYKYHDKLIRPAQVVVAKPS